MNIDSKITVVIVLYNSSEVIFECLKSLNNFQIIIVDNGKNLKILEKLKSKNNIQIITPGRNIGMGRGVNFAFNSIKSEFFLLLSPDTKIDEDSISKLLSTALNYDDCAIAAPLNVTDPDSYGVLPEKRELYEKNKNQIHINLEKMNKRPEGEICVDVTKGCVLLVRSKFFEKVGGFSEKYFLFWEEIDLCKRFVKKNYSIIVNPSSIAHHNEGTSSKINIENLFLRSFHHEISPLYYFEIKKNSLFLYRNILKYLFRTITYFLIFNFKSSLKNFSKLAANFIFLIK